MLEELHKRYGDRVQFLAVYVREAHPTDGWRVPSNDKAGISFTQPQRLEERNAIAQKCCSALEISMPVVVDGMDDRVGHTYSGMPDRLYLVDRRGRIAYKGGRGPFGFKTGELEQALVMLLLDETPVPAVGTAHGFPVLNDAEAWKYLPPAEKGAGQPLPAWARALVKNMPRTTAAMLELDYRHRVQSSLEPKLRAKMRWVAAHANGCAYTEASASDDLRRAGVNAAEIRDLTGNQAGLPATERAVLAFARQMTVAADDVKDEDVAQLVKIHGEHQVVAMVLLLAYANFQDRLILSLGLTPEKGERLRPVAVHFAKQTAPLDPATLPPRDKEHPASNPSLASAHLSDPEWLALDFSHLQKRMEGQRARQPRVRVPSWEEVRKVLPADYPVRKPWRIRWSLVCTGYQPELALGWSACTRAFGQEAQQDRVFEETLFWVVTRTLQCFY